MNKTDIDFTEAKQATISLVVGDEIVDKNDNKATVFYIDYIGKCVVVGSEGDSATVSFDVIAGGDYQQVVGDQRMPRESINNVKATISLVVGNKIVDNLGKIFEVAYIDYARENIIVVPIDDIAFGNRATVLTFGIVACNYQKVTSQKV